MTEMKRRWGIPWRPWHTNAALLVTGVALLLLSRQLVSEFDHPTIGLSGVSGWSVLCYAVAVWLVLTRPVDRLTFPLILTVGILCRLVLLLPAPWLSSDVYRYAWDGVVQHAHISPYRYVPGDPALAFLRQPNRDLFDHINRRDYAHTIYPPGAQILFYVVTFLNPTVTFMKLTMVLFEGLTMYALVALLRQMGRPREQTLLYAWCPLLLWEIGSSGHLDSAAMAFISLALLARYRRQTIATGLFLGSAILIKLYPLVLFPALFRRGQYRMPAVIVAMTAIGYGCYASVGKRVLGFFGGYVQEEGMVSGARYFLFELARSIPGLHRMPTAVFLVFTALLFAALALWCWRTCSIPRSRANPVRVFQLPAEADFLVPALAIAFALMLLFSPHYPWYVAWLVPLLALVPTLTVFTYVCGLYFLCTTRLAVSPDPSQPVLNEILYAAVAAAFLLELVLRRWTVRHPVFASEPQAVDQPSTLETESVKPVCAGGSHPAPRARY